MTHPLYDQMLPAWQACRDWAAGAVAVKAAGQRYLPPLGIHVRPGLLGGATTGADYEAFKKTASVFEAYKRTLVFLVGIAFSRPITALANALVPTKDMDGHLNSAAHFHMLLFKELLITSRGGVFVDFDDTRRRPYASLYGAEQIVDWDYDQAGNLVMADIETAYLDRSGDAPEMKSEFIEMRMQEGAFVYQRSRVNPDTNERETVPGTRKIPRYPNGSALDNIPLVLFSERGLGAEFAEPMLYGIVEKSISHYIADANLRHGSNIAARPTYYTIGDMGDDEHVIGATVAWNLPAGAEVGMIQFEGDSLKILMDIQKADKEDMAALGAKMLEPQRRGVEAAEALRLQLGGNSSTLSGAAEISVMVMRAVLRQMTRFVGGDPDLVEYDMDRNFVPEKMTPDELRVAMDAVDRGKLSFDTFLYNLNRGGWLPDERTPEEEGELIQLGAPGLFMQDNEE